SEVIAIEPARRASAAAPASATASTLAEPSPAAAAPEPSRIPQYLYLDTTALQTKSVPRIAQVVGKNLDAILANGPLELVVADPEPAIVLPSTSDADALRRVIARFPETATGKGRIYDVRMGAVSAMMEGENAAANTTASMGQFRGDLRASVREELTLIHDSLRRLDAWAATLPYDRASVVYLCNDGFDSDVTEVYRNILISGDQNDKMLAMQLQQEFGREAAGLATRAADALAGRGATAVLLAFGAGEENFAMSAANLDKMSSTSIRRPLGGAAVTFFARPFEPLLAVADRTGGSVVSAESRLPKALDDVGGAYLVSFRSQVPADGKTYPLEIVAASKELTVRAPRAVIATKSQEASAGKAVRALSAPPRPNLAKDAIPVTAEVSAEEQLDKGRTRGRLLVSAELGTIADALERVGPPRVRVTVAVEIPGKKPFTSSEDVTPDRSGEGTLWYYEAGITWPREATRVSVTVEELGTGFAGSAVASLPRP
ncbi:MAG TPA: hypothetical protein VH854_07685, partial [Thermoanaerobaculia bacterium]|nr:hypothetical protein [Thermoanaerobaculia bacterium]